MSARREIAETIVSWVKSQIETKGRSFFDNKINELGLSDLTKGDKDQIRDTVIRQMNAALDTVKEKS